MTRSTTAAAVEAERAGGAGVAGAATVLAAGASATACLDGTSPTAWLVVCGAGATAQDSAMVVKSTRPGAKRSAGRVMGDLRRG